MKTSSLSQFVLSMFVAVALLSAVSCGKGSDSPSDPTGGQTASSTSGAGGSTTSTTVTTGETTTSIATTGGGCVPSPANGNCGGYLPAGETYAPSACPDINGQSWTAQTGTVATVKIKIVDGYVMIYFGALLGVSMDPDFDGFLASGDGVYYKMGMPAEIRFEGHFNPDCSSLTGALKFDNGEPDHSISLRHQ